ncbi:MAG: histidine kinase dimerization/phosphoacceptor domain -containing protein [Gilvibacter sp.]
MIKSFLSNYLLFFITLFSLEGYSQQLDCDQVSAQLELIKTYKSNQVQMDSMRSFSASISRSNTPLELFNCLHALPTSDHIKLIYFQDYAPFLMRKGDLESSKKLREQGLQLAQQYGNLGLEHDYLDTMTSYYINVSKADSATLYINKQSAIVNANPTSFNNVAWMIYHRRGEIENILGNIQKQGEYYELAWEAMKKNPESDSQRGFLLYLVMDFHRTNKNIERQAYFTELLSEHYKEKQLKTPNLHLPINFLLLQNDSPEAIENLEQIIKQSDSLNNFNALSFCTQALSSALLKNNKPLEAIPYLERTISKLDSANYMFSHTGERDLLQQAYLMAGNYEKAYDVLADQKKVEDSLRNSEVLSKIADFEVKYDTQEKQRIVDQQKAQQKILRIVLFSGLALLLLVSLFLYKIRQKNKILAKQKQLLEVTVDEKNVLLKETHHRVKNSFQIVSSLLYLQSEAIEDKEAQIAIKEAQNRVRSMVLIHQKLYNKDQLVGINTQEYFDDLVKDIFESHQFEATPITYNTQIESMILDVETITPIGLILNELITNVLKHAFPSPSLNDKMELRFNKKGDNLILEIEDNGIGMTDNIQDSSFGIKLMKALSKKLKASIQYPPTQAKGTLVQLEITRFTTLD